MAVYHQKPNISATHKHPQTAWTQAGVHFVGVGPLLDQTGALRAAVHKFETGVASRDAMGWSLIQQGDARGGIWKHLWTQCWEKNYMEKLYGKTEKLWKSGDWNVKSTLLTNLRRIVSSQMPSYIAIFTYFQQHQPVSLGVGEALLPAPPALMF